MFVAKKHAGCPGWCLMAVLFTFFGLAAGSYWPAHSAPWNVPANFSELAETAGPAVVNIRVSKTVQQRNPFADDPFWQFFGGPNVPNGSRQVASAGSGVIVDADEGYILTNHHVIEDADVVEALQRRVIRYDKAGDRHYDVISAFIKSVRGSDPDAALY